MKKNLVKRIFMILMAVCLMTGTVCAATETTAVTAQAAAKKSQKVKEQLKSIKTKTTQIVNKKVKKKDKAKTKLKKLFVYVEKGYKSQNIMQSDYSDRWLKKPAYTNWEKDLALEMFDNKKGSCYHNAAAYAYLAKNVLGNKDKKNVRIAVGKTNGFSGKWQKHAWTEVKIGKIWYVCDPTLDRSKATKKAKYGTKYFLKKKNSVKKVYNKYKNTEYVYVTF